MAILTISRQLGSGGREVGQAVASSLGYVYVDKERFLEGLKALDAKWEQLAIGMDECRPSIFEKYSSTFAAYGEFVRSTILASALADKVVLMGRGGNFVLQGIPHAYRIRVIAPREARIQRIAVRESIDLESARRLVVRTDRERAGFVYALFGKPWDSSAEFDDVFDTGKRTIDGIIVHVVDRLAARDHLKTAEVEKLLRMRAVAAEIKARLLANPSTFAATLDVGLDGSELVVTGIVRGPNHFARIENEARMLAKDLPLRCEMHLRL